MSMTVRSERSQSPLLTRLSKLAPLDPEEVAIVQGAERNPRRSRARTELMRQDQPIRERRALLSGWACRQRILVEGQRQILSFLLPGDLIGSCHHSSPLAATTVLAVTEIETGAIPDAPRGSALEEALARSAAYEEHYFVAQITRIGRLDAYQRIIDWLLETCDRLAFVGLATSVEFPLPITQEFLADTLGLTSVHVNRMLQALRRDGLITSRGNTYAFPDRRSLERLVNYSPVRVSADDGVAT